MASEHGNLRPLDRSDPLPLWAQLVSELRRRLAAGAFGDRFPTEYELMTSYDISRHTVREALRRLRGEGLVVAERGRGSRVSQRPIEQGLGALYSLFACVEEQGLAQRSTVRALGVVTNPAVAGRLRLAEDAELVHLERLRLAGDEPLALDVSWLPAELTRPLLDADFTRTALYDELALRCGMLITGGEEKIRAVLPSAVERQLLGVGPNTAAFAIDRLGQTDDGPVEWRQTLVRADRFTLSVQWSPRTSYRLAAERSSGER